MASSCNKGESHLRAPVCEDARANNSTGSRPTSTKATAGSASASLALGSHFKIRTARCPQ